MQLDPVRKAQCARKHGPSSSTRPIPTGLLTAFDHHIGDMSLRTCTRTVPGGHGTAVPGPGVPLTRAPLTARCCQQLRSGWGRGSCPSRPPRPPGDRGLLCGVYLALTGRIRPLPTVRRLPGLSTKRDQTDPARPPGGDSNTVEGNLIRVQVPAPVPRYRRPAA